MKTKAKTKQPIIITLTLAMFIGTLLVLFSNTLAIAQPSTYYTMEIDEFTGKNSVDLTSKINHLPWRTTVSDLDEDYIYRMMPFWADNIYFMMLVVQSKDAYLDGASECMYKAKDFPVIINGNRSSINTINCDIEFEDDYFMSSFLFRTTRQILQEIVTGDDFRIRISSHVFSADKNVREAGKELLDLTK